MDAMRVCSECGEEKPLSLEYFTRHKTHTGGLNRRCKVCIYAAGAKRRAANPDAVRAKQREAQARYRARHPEEIKAKAKGHNARYRQQNKGKHNAHSAKWRRANPEKHKASIRNWQKANPERVQEIRRAWVAANPEKVSERGRRWRQKNPEYVYAKSKRWHAANPDKVRATKARIYAEIKAENGARAIRQRIATHIKVTVRNFLGNGSKGGKTWTRLVGYDLDTFMRHIERQFAPGMTWQNWGPVWHLNHIQPVASFNVTSVDCPEFRACWALSNLRPYPAKANISKGAKRLLLV
jgi:hypothetical protein